MKQGRILLHTQHNIRKRHIISCHIVPYIAGGSRKFTHLKVLSKYSYNLNVKACWRQVITLERCEDKVMTSGLFLSMKQKKRSSAFLLNSLNLLIFYFDGYINFDKVKRVSFGFQFWSWFWEGRKISRQCDVECGNQLIICFVVEENNGSNWSSSPITGLFRVAAEIDGN